MLEVCRYSFRAMGSQCEIVLATDCEQGAQAVAQEAMQEVKRIEAKYSRYMADSVLSLINAGAGGAPLACDEETWSLLNYADQLYVQSDGLFDITTGVLRRAWDFKNAVLPDAEKLATLLSRVGWHRVIRKNQTVALADGMEIDFGGLGKEYATDRAAHVLSMANVVHGYVNLAGDMRFLGGKPDGQAWMIGIQHPRQKDRICASLPMRTGGLATSGDYERFFERDGVRYCHVLDPRTGSPVQYWQSVSVQAPMAVLAGCVTTIAMLKQNEGLDFLQRTGLDYLAIDHAGQIHTRSN